MRKQGFVIERPAWGIFSKRVNGGGRGMGMGRVDY